MLARTPIKPSFKVDSPVQPAVLHNGPVHFYKNIIRRRRQLQSEVEAIVSSCFAQMIAE